MATYGPESVHIPGTYPHEQWQGSRLEGFVVARGEPMVAGLIQTLQSLKARYVA
jgi:hypothetical protein